MLFEMASSMLWGLKMVIMCEKRNIRCAKPCRSWTLHHHLISFAQTSYVRRSEILVSAV